MQHKACCPRAALATLIYLLRFTCYVLLATYSSLYFRTCALLSVRFALPPSKTKAASTATWLSRPQGAEGVGTNTASKRTRSTTATGLSFPPLSDSSLKVPARMTSYQSLTSLLLMVLQARPPLRIEWKKIYLPSTLNLCKITLAGLSKHIWTSQRPLDQETHSWTAFTALNMQKKEPKPLSTLSNPKTSGNTPGFF